MDTKSISSEYDEIESQNESTCPEQNGGKNACLPNVNRSLVYCKLFYFCYSSAMGSLWPYLPLFFRQLFLTPRQVGAIVACRTFLQFLFVPFWCAIAEKYRKHKEILLVALFAWLFSTVGILLVPREEPKACLTMHKLTSKQKDKASSKHWFDFSPLETNTALLLNRDIRDHQYDRDKRDHQYDRDKRDHRYNREIRKHRYDSDQQDNRELRDNREHRDMRGHTNYAHMDRRSEGVFDDYTPASILNSSADFASIYAEYDPEKHLSDTSRPFIFLLLITIFGVSLASPAQVIADICTIKRLKTQSQSFGKQAVWAAVGAALFAFIVGTFVNFLKNKNQCTKLIDINYSPCFYAFAFFMILTIIIATQFSFSSQETVSVDLNESIATFWECVRTINDVHLASLLVVTFCCGFGNGFISTFLFWHLREMGGLQILLALVSLINSTAEVMFYLLSDQLMGFIGHFRIIYLGLFFFSARFFYYSFLRQPWLVLPIEITHGMTSAAIRSAMISYIRQEGATGYMLHGLFNGIHGGLGFSVGGLVGGLMVHNYGHSITFLIFGEISLLTMFCFILVNNIWPHTKHDLKDMFTEDTTNLTDMYHLTKAYESESPRKQNSFYRISRHFEFLKTNSVLDKTVDSARKTSDTNTSLHELQ